MFTLFYILLHISAIVIVSQETVCRSVGHVLAWDFVAGFINFILVGKSSEINDRLQTRYYTCARASCLMSRVTSTALSAVDELGEIRVELNAFLFSSVLSLSFPCSFYSAFQHRVFKSSSARKRKKCVTFIKLSSWWPLSNETLH